MFALSVQPARLETEGDVWVRAVQAAGLEPMLMVSLWQANQAGNVTERYVPDDLDAYEAYVRSIVERDDGDGVDDMPGPAGPVRCFEVDNESDVKFDDGLRRGEPAHGRDARGGGEGDGAGVPVVTAASTGRQSDNASEGGATRPSSGAAAAARSS